MKKIIITGATSMIGIALINECVRGDISVTAVVRGGSDKIKTLPASSLVSVAECSLEDFEKLPQLIKEKHDAFYHLAWGFTDKQGRHDPEMQERNIGYTLSAVKAASAAGCGVFIGAGSQAEYGRVDGTASSDIKAAPETAYGTAKFAAGKLSAMICSRLSLRHIWTRIFSVYGPHDSPATMISYVISALLKGEKPQLTKCGQKWDYLYCADAARALIMAGKSGRDGATYNIGSGKARPLKEYVGILRDAVDPGLKLGIGEKEYEPKQVMHLRADIKPLMRDTGFKPAYSFEKGIKETIEWSRRGVK